VPEPSIKGTAFQSVVEDVKALVDSGRISRDALEARLCAVDLEILDDKIQPAAWYPIDCYRRLSELLLEMEGGGRTDYLRRRGARAAERLFAAGLYQQLLRGEEIGEEIRQAGRRWTTREGNLMATLAGAIFSFSRWRFSVESHESSRIEVTEAEVLPEVARHAAEGFIAYTASRLSGSGVRVTSERPTADTLRFVLRSS
jgi:hypothetical protein